MNELEKTVSLKIRLYNPPISPKSTRDLNDIKIGLVFAEDKLCCCSTVFFSLFQRCSTNDSSQQWLTRPVSSPKVTVKSWKIEPLFRCGKNKARHPIHDFENLPPLYTDCEGLPATPARCSRTKHQTVPSIDLCLALVGVHYSVCIVKWPQHKNRQECEQVLIITPIIIPSLPVGAPH